MSENVISIYAVIFVAYSFLPSLNLSALETHLNNKLGDDWSAVAAVLKLFNSPLFDVSDAQNYCWAS